MAEDWAANVKKYVPDADDGIIAGIVRYCGIALQKRDSSLVSFSDPAETKRVRENFLKKKLGLTQTDDKLDEAIAAVGARMKGENFKNRVTVYYLLAENFGLLGMFAKAAKAAPAATAKATPAKPAAGKAAAVASLASLGANDSDKAKSGGVGGVAGAAGAAALGAAGAVAAGALSGAKAVGETAADAAGAVASGAKAAGESAIDAAGAAGAAVAGAAGTAAAAMGSATSGAAQALTGGHADDDENKGGWGWLIWLLLAALVLGVLWWLFHHRGDSSANGGATTEQSAAPAASDGASATPPPAEGTVAIPTGAGVTTETRDGKPVVKVYFDTGKAEVVPAFGGAAGGLKAYLDSHAGSSLAVSGFNDKTGNAAANALLSKNRAQAVKTALVASGIADAAVALVKPADTTDAKVDNAGARRVEVVVK